MAAAVGVFRSVRFGPIQPSRRRGRRLASEFGGSIFITRLNLPKPEREFGDPRPLSRQFDSPSWGATGRLALTFGASTGAVGHIATMRPNGSDLRLVTRSACETAPDWSPQGDRIVFSRVKSRETVIPTGVIREPGTGRLLGDTRLAITRGRGEGQRLLANRLPPLSRISWQPRPRR